MKTMTLLTALLVLAGSARATAAEPSFERDVAPFLKQHCLACHGPDKPKGGVRLDGPKPDLVDGKQAETWQAAKRMMAQGEMPPEGKARPKADELIAVMAWIDDAAARAATVTRGGIGRRALRRLTAREYVNTVQDLLGLSFPHATLDLAARLPSDGLANSFSNDSNVQVMQTLQLRRSLDLVEDLLAVALPKEGAIKPLRYEVDLRQLAGDKLAPFAALPEAERMKLRGPAIQNVVVPSGLPGGEPARLSVRGDRNGPLAAEHLDGKRGLLLEPNPITIGVNQNAITLVLPLVPDRGVLRLKARAAALIEHDDSSPVLRLSLGGPQGPGNVAYPIALVNVTAPGDASREYVLDVPLALADGDWNSFRREKRLVVQIDNAAAPLGPTPVPANYDQKQRDRYLKRNRLVLHSFTLEIEPSATWPPRSEAVLLVRRDGEEEHSWAERSLRAFLARAFHRPPTQAELNAFSQLYRNRREAGGSFLTAYRTTLAAALVSPQVYYLVETKETDRRPLTACELAARLSYLVWNTTPDTELLARAVDGSLLTDAELRRQFERLLIHERAFVFAREFTRQWLDLDVIAHLEPAVMRQARSIDGTHDLQWYDKVIRRDLATEPAHYLLDLLRNDRPISELVAADHMVVNDRLARYYGVAGVRGPAWQPVAAPENRRGGLLTQAGCIAAATHAQERGEIKRGVYLARRILGIDIPTPPGNVDIKPLDVQVVEDKSLLQLTARQHMERHRTIATCAVCHQRSDPLGFVWDEFDMYGQPKRDRLGKLLPFDSSGQLPNKTPFASFQEFRKLLVEGASADGRFSVAFSQRLYGYVLGRGLDHGDDAHLKQIRASATKDGGGLRALMTAMVLSEPFRNK